MKKNKLNEIDFYLVTDSGLSRNGTLTDVKQALDAGCRIVQYREKQKSTKEMIEEAYKIKNICGTRAIFLVNDRVDVTMAVDADGVHIGQDDMPYEIARELLGMEKIIGVTVHDVEESFEAGNAGADYIGLSPIFETGTKKDAGIACGTSMIERVREELSLPIVAIGGIDKKNAGEVIRSGADAAVAISAVLCVDDVYKEVKNFIEIIQGMKKY